MVEAPRKEMETFAFLSAMESFIPVSYTHLAQLGGQISGLFFQAIGEKCQFLDSMLEG